MSADEVMAHLRLPQHPATSPRSRRSAAASTQGSSEFFQETFSLDQGGVDLSDGAGVLGDHHPEVFLAAQQFGPPDLQLGDDLLGVLLQIVHGHINHRDVAQPG